MDSRGGGKYRIDNNGDVGVWVYFKCHVGRPVNDPYVNSEWVPESFAICLVKQDFAFVYCDLPTAPSCDLRVVGVDTRGCGEIRNSNANRYE